MTETKVFMPEPGVDYHQFTAEPHDIHITRRDGEVYVNVQTRFVHHSPTGFGYGYGGSGPSDLALNILGAFLLPPEAFRLHQDFKWGFISGLNINEQEHTISGRIIKAWIEQRWGMR